jgi:glyoxylase I family protein
MQTPGLNHIVLTISDIARSRQFYGELLGFQINDINYDAGNLTLGFSFEVGGVAFFFLKHNQTVAGDKFSETRLGLDHISFTAPNEAELKAMADKLLAAGVNTNGVETFVNGDKYMAFRDPDNIQLEYWLAMPA